MSRVPFEHEPFDVSQLFVQVLEPSFRFPVLGVPQILLVFADDLTFDTLPRGGAFVLLPELLLQLSETFGDFVDGLVQVAVLVVLRIEIFLVAAALLARDDTLVLKRVLGLFRSGVRHVHHVLGRIRTRVGCVRAVR